MEYVWLMVARELAKWYIFPNDTRHPIAPCARDSDWIASNLGDVPMRIVDADSVPVESLGRES